MGQWTNKANYAYDTGTYAGHAFFGTCGGTIVLDCTVEQLQTPVLPIRRSLRAAIAAALAAAACRHRLMTWGTD